MGWASGSDFLSRPDRIRIYFFFFLASASGIADLVIVERYSGSIVLKTRPDQGALCKILTFYYSRPFRTPDFCIFFFLAIYITSFFFVAFPLNVGFAEDRVKFTSHSVLSRSLSFRKLSFISPFLRHPLSLLTDHAPEPGIS